MLSIGIIGLPNVGKSTLFNALLKSRLAEAANFAFTTIEPNVGIVELPDERLEGLAEVAGSARAVPSAIKFVDIAGLVGGAHKGEGLGNKFLSHIREVDAIVQVARCFEDKNVAHISGRLFPKEDLEVVLTELALADLELLDKKLAALEKGRRLSPKESLAEREICGKIKKELGQGRPIVLSALSSGERKRAAREGFLTAKPMILAFNVAEEEASAAPEDIIEEYGLEGVAAGAAVVVSAKLEEEIVLSREVDQDDIRREFGLGESGLDRLVRAAYRALDLICFFTANENETRQWALPRGNSALAAAGKVHGDFAKKFVKAEVIFWEEFVRLGGWKGAREAGRVRVEGRDYEVKDGEVIFIRHG